MADVKQTLNGWINYSAPKLGTFLARTWKNQQQAITYKELREAIMNGQLDLSYLNQWRQDYSNFIINAYAPLAQQAIDNSVKAITAQFGAGSKILQNSYIDSFIATNGGKLIREVSEAQFKAINVLVRQAAMSEGMDIQELAKAIRPTVGLTQRMTQATFNHYEQAKKTALKDGYTEKEAQEIARKKQAIYAERMHRKRAETIAITEMAYAYNWGQQAYMKQCITDGSIGGCQTQWSTADDEKVCEECGPMDGVITEIDDDFVVEVPDKHGGKKEIHGPAVPPMHPRCRCVCNYINVLPPADWVDTPIDAQAAAQPAPDDYDIPEDFDWSNTGLDFKGKINLGGTGEMYIFEDPTDGTQFLFKPAQAKYSGNVEEFRAYIQEAGYKVQGIIDPDTCVVAGTGYVDIPGKGSVFGAAQMKVENIDKSFDLWDWQNNGGPIDPSIVSQIQRESVTDWLLCNYDSHGRNFVYTTDGRLIGVDKEQAFRYINMPEAQSLSLTFHPNAKYGESETIYNTMYRRFADGQLDIKLNDALAYIKRVEAIPDDQYREIFRKYAESLHGAGAKAEQLLDQIVLRKQNCRQTFETFYSELLTKRKGTATVFTFADTAAATGPANIPTVASTLLSPQTLKGLKIEDLYAMAKAQGIKNYGLFHKDELAEALADPSKIPQIHQTALDRHKKQQEAKRAKQAAQAAGGARTLEGIPQAADAIKNPEAVLQNATPRGVALIGDSSALEGMEANLRKVTIDGQEFYELTGKMTQTRWEQALNSMSAAQNGSYWRFNEVSGSIDYTQPVLGLTGTTRKIQLGTQYIRNGDDIIIVAGTDATNNQRALMGQFNIRVLAGPDAGMRMQQLINQAGMQDVFTDATKDALERYKKMRAIWQTDAKAALNLNPATASDAQIDTTLRTLGITKSRLDAMKVTKIQDGYWTLIDPENGAIARRNDVAYIYHQIFDKDQVAPVLKSGELLSTANRWGRGITVGGMSSEEDIRTGGADSVFTRIVFKGNIGNDSYYNNRAVTLIFDKSVLERTDWYAYKDDSYGRTTERYMSRRYGTEAHLQELQRRYDSSNEIMFRKTVPLDKLTEIRVYSDRDRDDLIDALHNAGITEYNGIKIEDLIKAVYGKL